MRAHHCDHCGRRNPPNPAFVYRGSTRFAYCHPDSGVSCYEQHGQRDVTLIRGDATALTRIMRALADGNVQVTYVDGSA